MKQIRHFFLIVFLLLTSISSVWAQGDAGQAGEFLRYGVGARALGMGRAYVGIANNANAIYWNPGGLNNLIRKGISLTLMYTQFYQSTSYNFAALAIPMELFLSPDQKQGLGGELRNWNIAFGYLGLNSDGYEVRNRENQATGQEFSDSQTAIFLTAARSIVWGSHRFGIGVNYKILRHDLFDLTSNTAAIDVGIKYQPSLSWLQVGAMFQNVNQPDFRFSGGGEDIIPFSARIGMAIQLVTGNRVLDALLISADVVPVPPGRRKADWFLGLEYDVQRLLYSLPIKIRIGTNSRENFTMGFNLDLPNNVFFTAANKVLPVLDWAFLPDQKQGLGSLPNRFSLEFTFTPLTSERWYLRGREKIQSGQFFLAQEDLNKAVASKNPKKLGFPLAALLRLGDLEVIKEKNKLLGLKKALPFYIRAQSFERVQNEVDAELNHISYLNFLQGLYLEGRFQDVIRYSSQRTIWQHHDTRYDRDENVIALKAWSYYMADDSSSARRTAEEAREAPLCKFLLALQKLEKKDFSRARRLFLEIVKTGKPGIPDVLIASPFRDGSLIDDAQLLYAYAGVKMKGYKGSIDLATLAEFAMIARYYPQSDMNRFLQEDNRLETILQLSGSSSIQILDNLFASYLRALKMGHVSVDHLVSRRNSK